MMSENTERRNRSYRDLEAWRESVELVVLIYRLTETFPKAEQFGIISQIQRSSISVSANIAEGQGRLHRGDFVHHLSIARGSLYETESHIAVALRLGFLTKSAATHVESQIGTVARLLNGLIRSQRQPD